MSENKATLQEFINKTVVETAITFEAGVESGYKKGVRDMFEAVKNKCSERMFISCSNSAICGDIEKRESNVATCHINNCPIAKKLLKAVK